jgi:plasmid stabilization system protein ParE
MPRVVLAPAAGRDLQRIRRFLAVKNPAASKRAAAAIKEGIKQVATTPEGYRPVEDMPFHREIVIKFGASGYVARYFYQPGGDVLTLRVKHQLEDDLPESL